MLAVLWLRVAPRDELEVWIPNRKESMQPSLFLLCSLATSSGITPISVTSKDGHGSASF